MRTSLPRIQIEKYQYLLVYLNIEKRNEHPFFYRNWDQDKTMNQVTCFPSNRVFSLATSLFVMTLFGVLPSHAESAKEARIPAGEVLERAAEAWETIHDYQAVIHLLEEKPGQGVKENWAQVSVVQATQETSETGSVCLIELFNQPVSLINKASPTIENSTRPTPNKKYFSDGVILYTIDPKGNTVTIEYLDQSGPLPEFMQLAGFLELDIEELKEKAYLDDVVLDVPIDNTPTYRVTINPRQKVRDIEPTRYIWIDRETYLPKRFAYEAELSGKVEFLQYIINQNLKTEQLIPIVKNPKVFDLRK